MIPGKAPIMPLIKSVQPQLYELTHFQITAEAQNELLSEIQYY